MIGAQTKFTSGNSKSSDTYASVDKANADTDDEDDLPFDLSIDSGSLTCVACGILSYLVFYCYFNSGLQSLKYKKIHGLKKVTSNLFSIKYFKLV